MPFMAHEMDSAPPSPFSVTWHVAARRLIVALKPARHQQPVVLRPECPQSPVPAPRRAAGDLDLSTRKAWVIPAECAILRTFEILSTPWTRLTPPSTHHARAKCVATLAVKCVAPVWTPMVLMLSSLGLGLPWCPLGSLTRNPLGGARILGMVQACNHVVTGRPPPPGETSFSE